MTAIDLTALTGTPAHTTSTRIASLGRAIDSGVEPDPCELLLLAHTARDLGIDDVLVNVMIDDEQPTVARVRAFSRVSVQVAARLHQIDETTEHRHPELLPC